MCVRTAAAAARSRNKNIFKCAVLNESESARKKRSEGCGKTANCGGRETGGGAFIHARHCGSLVRSDLRDRIRGQ